MSGSRAQAGRSGWWGRRRSEVLLCWLHRVRHPHFILAATGCHWRVLSSSGMIWLTFLSQHSGWVLVKWRSGSLTLDLPESPHNNRAPIQPSQKARDKLYTKTGRQQSSQTPNSMLVRTDHWEPRGEHLSSRKKEKQRGVWWIWEQEDPQQGFAKEWLKFASPKASEVKGPTARPLWTLEVLPSRTGPHTEEKPLGVESKLIRTRTTVMKESGDPDKRGDIFSKVALHDISQYKCYYYMVTLTSLRSSGPWPLPLNLGRIL